MTYCVKLKTIEVGHNPTVPKKVYFSRENAINYNQLTFLEQDKSKYFFFFF